MVTAVSESADCGGAFAESVQLSAGEALAALDRVAPGVGLVAFGQTAFWDEPMKAALAAETERPMMVGIHGLDYFSRLRECLPGGEWQVVARNDGSLREAWIAAGELSALFGAEAGPTRQVLTEAGVGMSGGSGEAGFDAATDEATSSWGWRGIVQNKLRSYVVCETPVAEMAGALRELLGWGFGETAKVLADARARRHVRRLLAHFLGEIDRFVAEEPGGGVCAFFKRVFAETYCRLLGSVPENVRIASTLEVFRFSPQTARLGRFGLVRSFLCGRTAETARAAYDAAVAGTATQGLASFGPEATPFDVYVPGRGRGTLHVGGDRVRVDFARPVTLALRRPLRGLCALAETLADGLGGEVALVGKALVLPVMLAGEFVNVLHETGSAYLPRTRRMLQALTAAGVRLRLYPVLRVRLRTWDMLRGCKAEFGLPRHLAESFERKVRGAGGRWCARRGGC